MKKRKMRIWIKIYAVFMIILGIALLVLSFLHLYNPAFLTDDQLRVIWLISSPFISFEFILILWVTRERSKQC